MSIETRDPSPDEPASVEAAPDSLVIECRAKDLAACHALGLAMPLGPAQKGAEGFPHQRALDALAEACEHTSDKSACEHAGLALSNGGRLGLSGSAAFSALERACAKGTMPACAAAGHSLVVATFVRDVVQLRAGPMLERCCEADDVKCCSNAAAVYMNAAANADGGGDRTAERELRERSVANATRACTLDPRSGCGTAAEQLHLFAESEAEYAEAKRLLKRGCVETGDRSVCHLYAIELVLTRSGSSDPAKGHDMLSGFCEGELRDPVTAGACRDLAFIHTGAYAHPRDAAKARAYATRACAIYAELDTSGAKCLVVPDVEEALASPEVTK